MNKITFVPISFWDRITMMNDPNPTPEQWAEVEKVCKLLNDKYISDAICNIHPDKEQKIVVGLFNGFVDIQIVPSDTCGCYDAMLKLAEIRNYESLTLNNG